MPWEHAAQSLPPNFERFGPLMAGAIRRFPFLGDAEVIRLVCHPDAMTPDANPLLGPLPGVRGFLGRRGPVAQRLRRRGRVGRAMAGWITAGDPGLDIGPYRASRFGGPYRDPGVRGRPGPRDVLGLLPPALSVRCRPGRPAAPAVRAPRPAPGGRRRLRDEGRLGARRPPSPGALAARRARPGGVGLDTAAMVRAGRRRGRAVRERAGLIDLSSFGKISVAGPGRARPPPAGRREQHRSAGRQPRLQPAPRRARRHRGRRHDRPPRGGSLPVRDRRGLPGRRPCLAAGPRRSRRSRRSSPRRKRRAGGHRPVGAAGPDDPGPGHGDDVGDAAIPLRRVPPIQIHGAARQAARISYAGELGWELYLERAGPPLPGTVLLAAARPSGARAIRLSGARRAPARKGLPLLRDRPDDARHPLRGGPRLVRQLGLGAVRRPRGAPAAARERAGWPAPPAGDRRRGHDRWLPADLRRRGRPPRGRVIGRLRSAAYGPTVERTIGTVYVPARLAEGTALEVDMFAERVPADGRGRRRSSTRAAPECAARRLYTAASQPSKPGPARLADARPQRSSAQPQKS